MEVIFFDKDIVVCVKPVGIDSEKQLPDLLKEQLGGEMFTIHRLDLNVGGVMVYARSKKSAAVLSRCIQEGSMVKEYIARVHGVTPENGDWIDLLWKDSRKNKVFVVKRMRKGVKEARLEFNRINSDNDISTVHIRLYTGRSHQIRVQFSSRGYPLIGDHKYGSRDERTSPLLFSCKISFPYKGKIVSFEKYPEWM